MLTTRSGARFRVRFASWKVAPAPARARSSRNASGKLHRADAHLLPIGGDLLDPEQPAGHPQGRDREQGRHLRRERAVPVDVSSRIRSSAS